MKHINSQSINDTIMKKLLTLLTYLFVSFTANAQTYHLDVNGNGSIDLTDALTVVNYILGRINPEDQPSSDGQIVMERKLYVHHGNNYSYPCVTFWFDNNQMLTIGYMDADYWKDWDGSIKGIHIRSLPTDEKNGFSNAGPETTTKDWYVGPNILDEWFTEKVVINTDGRVEYYINNNFMGEEVFDALKLNEASSFKVEMSPWGWWTNHYTYMDDFYLFTPATTVTDNFNDGVIDLSIWRAPVNPDGIREEDGIIKMEQLRTDQNFCLYIDDVPLCAAQTANAPKYHFDVNNDGSIELTDALIIIDYILGRFVPEGEWYMVAKTSDSDTELVPVKEVGSLVAVDDALDFTILGLSGEILLEKVLRVDFKPERDLNITPSAPLAESPRRMISREVRDRLTLVGVSGMVGIYDKDGVRRMTAAAHGCTTDIGVAHLPAGAYTAKVGKQTFKFVKK